MNSKAISSERKEQIHGSRKVVLAKIKELSRPLWFEFCMELTPEELQYLVEELDTEGDPLLPKDGVAFEVARNVWSGKTKPGAVTYTPLHARADAAESVRAGNQSFSSRSR